jgi:hypothetical protein
MDGSRFTPLERHQRSIPYGSLGPRDPRREPPAPTELEREERLARRDRQLLLAVVLLAVLYFGIQVAPLLWADLQAWLQRGRP